MDAYLYDEAGALVSERRHWLLARRRALTRGRVAELLPPGCPSLIGQLVLAFSDDDKPAYPRTLQALVEYETPQNTTRVMLWSDEWNSPQRATRRGRVPFRAFYRAWCRPPLETRVCISNAANERAYADAAIYTASLITETGKRQTVSGCVPPHGTAVWTVTEMFPDARAFVGDRGLGIVLIESDFDLAEMQLTRHAHSGVVVAEHFMAIPTLHTGEDSWPSGA